MNISSVQNTLNVQVTTVSHGGTSATLCGTVHVEVMKMAVHLELIAHGSTNVKEFQCPHNISKYFKCPGYYCVPWRYICNSVWDCPNGDDEVDCEQRNSCPGQYKCNDPDRVTCIGIESIRDKEQDCKYNDDEFFDDISVQLLKCPDGCNCLLFSIACIADGDNSTLPADKFYNPYKVIFLSNYQIQKTVSIFEQFPKAVAYSLMYNSITKVCDILWKTDQVSHIHILGLANNLVKSLDRYCFNHMTLLRFLNISSNRLNKIIKHTFSNISQIESLDLSSNQIFVLEEKCFSGSNHLAWLNLAGNALLVINVFSLDGMPDSINISSDGFKICCIKRSACLATVSATATNQCRFTLLKSVVSVFMMTFGILGIILCSLVVLLNVLNIGDLGGHNYRSTIIALSLSDLCCSLSILIIGLANTVYGNSYFEQEYYWKQHILCYTCAVFIIAESFISCGVINILAISRLQVVRFPFDSRFLEHVEFRFVVTLLVATGFISILLGIIIATTYWLSSGQFHTGFCVIFGNVKDSVYLLSITMFIMLIYFLSMFSVPVIYYAIYRILRESENTSAGSQKQKAKSALKQFSLSFISPFYWLSSNIILITMLILNQPSSDLLMWFVALILPLKTLIHPFVFTFKTVFMFMMKHSQLFVISN